tara:strand:+ start:236 stop:4585 length:4350 start_codon:yes stop_codon:yes gene_type:complete
MVNSLLQEKEEEQGTEEVAPIINSSRFIAFMKNHDGKETPQIQPRVPSEEKKKKKEKEELSLTKKGVEDLTIDERPDIAELKRLEGELEVLQGKVAHFSRAEEARSFYKKYKEQIKEVKEGSRSMRELAEKEAEINPAFKEVWETLLQDSDLLNRTAESIKQLREQKPTEEGEKRPFNSSNLEPLNAEQVKIDELAFEDNTEISPTEIPPSSTLDALLATTDRMAADAALVVVGLGLIEPEDAVDFIAKHSVRLYNAQKHAPQYMRDFIQEWEEAENWLESLGVVLMNPRAIGRLTIENLPYSAPSIGVGLAGGTIGSVVPFFGTIIGFATGTFAGGSAVEIGAFMDEELLDMGIDITNPEELLAVLQNEKVLKRIFSRAKTKGFTTAGIDAFLTLIGGRFFTAVGRGIRRKAAAFAAEQVFEAGGEFTSEFIGRLAATGEKDIKGAALEAIISTPQSATQTFITIANIKKGKVSARGKKDGKKGEEVSTSKQETEGKEGVKQEGTKEPVSGETSESDKVGGSTKSEDASGVEKEETIADALEERFTKLEGEKDGKKEETEATTEVLDEDIIGEKTNVDPANVKVEVVQGLTSDVSGRPLAAKADLENGVILIDEEQVKKTYDEEAWTKPKVEGVRAFTKNAFRSLKEWRDFLIEHERVHFTKANQALPKGAEKENHANDVAFAKVFETAKESKERKQTKAEELSEQAKFVKDLDERSNFVRDFGAEIIAEKEAGLIRLLTKPIFDKLMDTIKKNPSINLIKDFKDFDITPFLNSAITDLFHTYQVILDETKNIIDLQQIRTDGKPAVAESKEVIKDKDVGESEKRASFLERLQKAIRKAIFRSKQKGIAITPMNVVFDMMGKAAQGKGAMFRLFKKPIDKAYTAYTKIKIAEVGKINTLIKNFGMTDENLERIAVFAVLEQEGGRQKLQFRKDKNGIEIKEKGKFSERALDKLEAEGLSGDEKQVLTSMRQAFDRMKKQLIPILRDVYGRTFKEVENFFPFLTDFEAMERTDIEKMFGNDVPLVELTGLSTLPFKQREGGSNQVKLNAKDIFSQHIDNAAYMIEMGEIVNRLQNLNTETKDIIGEFSHGEVKAWLKLMQRKNNPDSKKVPWLDWIRNNAGVAILGFKLSTIVIQPTAAFDAMALIGSKAVFQGMNNFLLHSKWRKFIKGNFLEVMNRMGGEQAILDIVESNTSRVTLTKIKRASFWGLRTVDGITAASVAAGAYQKYVEDRGGVVDFNNPDQEAIAHAEEIVQRTQGSALAKDAPAAVTRGAFFGNISVDKAFFQFQTFALTRFSLVSSALSEFKEGNVLKPTLHTLNVMTYLTLAAMAATAARVTVDELFELLPGDVDEDETAQENFIKKFVRELLTIPPFVPNFTSAIVYKSSSVPAIDMVIQSFARIGIAATAADENKMLQATRAVILSAGSLGYLPGAKAVDDIVNGIFKENKW